MNDALKKEIEYVLSFSCNLYKGMNFALYKQVMAPLRYYLEFKEFPTTEEENIHALELFEKLSARRAEVLSQLPADVLEGVEDLQAYAWGYMKKQERTRLLEYAKLFFPIETLKRYL